MESQSPQTTNSEPAKGLPVVVPLTGRYIAQLFLVPGIIVAIAVLVLLAFNWLAGGSRTPEEFLANLDNTNTDIRWRAASDLAQVLVRNDQLASNPWFALELSDRLQKALDECDRDERAFLEGKDKLSEADQKKQLKNLHAKQNYALYLMACLGNMSLPVGVPLLTKVAQKGNGLDETTISLFRRRAVWALVHLGENQHQKRLSDEQLAAAVKELQKEASSSNGDRRQWAQAALDYLESRQSLGVIPVLAECATYDDYFLREVVAFALGVWEGNAAESALAENTLAALARDDGRAKLIKIENRD
jgi:hypothetical protein